MAYLDGKTPSLIMQRGTYNLIKTQALDKDLKRIWYWESSRRRAKYTGQGSHGLIAADVDNDGRDELVIGAAVLDDTGKGLWSLEMGHPDICYVADIDPANPGLEIFYGFEVKRQTDGLCVVDARPDASSGRTRSPRSIFTARAWRPTSSRSIRAWRFSPASGIIKKRWVYSASGKLIEFSENLSLTPRPLWWDGDPQKEVILGRSIQDWNGPAIQPIEGRVIAVMDCLGDHREEVIACVKGELRIYSTTIPAPDRRPCLLQDHLYRMGVAAQTMGYYYPAQLGGNNDHGDRRSRPIRRRRRWNWAGGSAAGSGGRGLRHLRTPGQRQDPPDQRNRRRERGPRTAKTSQALPSSSSTSIAADSTSITSTPIGSSLSPNSRGSASTTSATRNPWS